MCIWNREENDDAGRSGRQLFASSDGYAMEELLCVR
jgi:hypothetical protein